MPSAEGASSGVAAGASGGTSRAGAGSTAAAGGIAAGAVVAKKAAAAGPNLGNFVAASANGQSQADPASSPTGPPHVADSTLAERAGSSR